MDKLSSSFELLLNLGGPVVVVLLIFSVTGTAIILLKFWQFFALRLGSSKICRYCLADLAGEQSRPSHRHGGR